MKTVLKLTKKVLQLTGIFGIGFFLLAACSTVKENGEPNVTNVPTITTDEQRKAIYERGVDNVRPQNANPVPTSEELGLDENASEINRKKNIEEGGNQNAPSNTPTEERPRELRNVGNDTITR